jgi:hypothetical protein
MQRFEKLLLTIERVKQQPGNIQMVDWTPVILVIFKAIVLGTGMFFAIKWHYDQGKKGKQNDKRALLRAGGKAAAIFVLLLLGVLVLTFVLAKALDLNLSTW